MECPSWTKRTKSWQPPPTMKTPSSIKRKTLIQEVHLRPLMKKINKANICESPVIIIKNEDFLPVPSKQDPQSRSKKLSVTDWTLPFKKTGTNLQSSESPLCPVKTQLGHPNSSFRSKMTSVTNLHKKIVESRKTQIRSSKLRSLSRTPHSKVSILSKTARSSPPTSSSPLRRIRTFSRRVWIQLRASRKMEIKLKMCKRSQWRLTICSSHNPKA